jgi:hypothetical protein
VSSPFKFYIIATSEFIRFKDSGIANNASGNDTSFFVIANFDAFSFLSEAISNLIQIT